MKEIRLTELGRWPDPRGEMLLIDWKLLDELLET